jgi:hypothetical protein
MVEAHDRLQRAAAEMNTLRFSTRRNLSDVDLLSQQLSEIPADLSGSPLVSSPVSHRSKRSRLGETPATRIQRTPLTTLKNRVNRVPVTVQQTKKDVDYSGSVTQDEEEEGRQSPVKRIVPISSEYGDLIPDEDGFSQFDI